MARWAARPSKLYRQRGVSIKNASCTSKVPTTTGTVKLHCHQRTATLAGCASRTPWEHLGPTLVQPWPWHAGSIITASKWSTSDRVQPLSPQKGPICARCWARLAANPVETDPHLVATSPDVVAWSRESTLLGRSSERKPFSTNSGRLRPEFAICSQHMWPGVDKSLEPVRPNPARVRASRVDFAGSSVSWKPQRWQWNEHRVSLHTRSDIVPVPIRLILTCCGLGQPHVA